MSKQITWVSVSAETLPERVLCGAEMLLGVAFPAAYRECVRRYHGGRPEPDAFTVFANGRSWTGSIGVLLSLDARRPENLWAVLAGLAIDGQLPDGLIPLSVDGGGDLLCFDYRHAADEPPVVYWSHEVGGSEGVSPVAATFAELLLMLR